MLYKFKSKAAGDVIMMGANGDQVLRILGRAPAAKGIFEVADLGAAIGAIEAAAQRDDDARATARAEAAAEGKRYAPGDAITLRQRAWPLLEMMRRSQAADVEVVWGV